MASITSSSLTTSATPSPTDTGAPQQNSTNGPSSPLLFFVALGFGVVFTNLWIIVGVKYCFRYNQRNRARLAGEDPDGVGLDAMPRQRRRREKKLMTIDEVNERFPLVKYKTWRATRADQGLPTAGGITNAPSRPVSIKDHARLSKDESEVREVDPKTPTTSTFNEKDMTTSTEHGRAEQVTDTPAVAERSDIAKPALVAPEPALVRTNSHEEETDPTDRIQTAIPPEQLPDPGDTCAICIDTIEDDDDIRGLVCGHAFHASCVDPWLTSRRACCPLCKADYYVPKPRPEGTQEEARRNSRAEQLVQGPGSRRARNGSFNLTGVFLSSAGPNSARRNRPDQRDQPQSNVTDSTPEVTTGEQESRSWRTRLPTVPALSRIRRGRGNEAGEQPAQTTNPTPAQLEAGRT